MKPSQTGSSPWSAPLAGLAWLDRYASMPLIFIVLAAAVFLIAWNRGIALLYALLAILIGVALFSVLGARLMMRAATIRLRVPQQAAVGEAIEVGVAVAPRAWPRKRYLLMLRSPYPFAPEQHVFLALCGAKLMREQRVVCTRRGVFRFSDALVSSAYPLGLVTVKRNWPIDAGGITVRPRIYPVASFSLPVSSSRSSADLERPAPSRGQELFREVREYRSGDNPRHIHWRSSARRGELVVKQFDAVSSNETWIVLDLDPASHAGRGEDHSFERAIEIAVSIAAYQIRNGLRCGIAGGMRADGSPLLLLRPNSSAGYLQTIIDALTVLRADCAAPYDSVLQGLSSQYRAGQQWILFKHGEEEVALPACMRNQPSPFWFRFDTHSFADVDWPRRTLQPPVRHSDGFRVARDTDFSLLFQSS